MSPSQDVTIKGFEQATFETVDYGYFSAGLPSVVLAPLSTIALQILRQGDSGNAFSIENVVVAMTRASLPTEINSGDDTVPLLTPENLDEQAT